MEYLEAGSHPMQKIEISGANIEELEKVESYSDSIDFLVGVGGGRPIDLAKQAGFNKDIPFISIPTGFPRWFWIWQELLSERRA